MVRSTLFIVVLFCVVFGAFADDDDDEGCTICTKILTDFNKELSGKDAQNVFDRLCDDILFDEKDYDQDCKSTIDSAFGVIRTLLKAGDTPKDICKAVGACGWLEVLTKRLNEKKISGKFMQMMLKTQ